MLLLLLFVSVFQVKLKAQVTVDVKIDSLELLVGQQALVTLDVSFNAKSQLQLPALKQGSFLIPGVEVVEAFIPDTQQLNDGARLLVTQKYRITSFDSAFYYLPPFVVKVDNKEYKSKNLALKVVSFPVDTAHVDQFFGPKTIMRPPFSWDDWASIFYVSVSLLLAILILVYIYARYKANKPIIRIIRITPKVPPHKKAMEEINQIKAEKTWAQEDSKEYYIKLTATLRTYIQNRYGFNAMEMTSSEIIDHLMRQDEKALDELRALFYTADLVKFAKYNTMINENDMNLVNAVDFIDRTKMEEAETDSKPQPTVINVEDKRSRKTTITLRITMILLGVFSVAMLVWICWALYKLLQ